MLGRCPAARCSTPAAIEPPLPASEVGAGVTQLMGCCCPAVFAVTQFNTDISGWNVAQVTSMEQMFRNTAFDRDITSWNVAQVTSMAYMFYQATAFEQDPVQGRDSWS